ncbi:Protein saf4 [Purpureocillium takamizusanense]|uniref:Protein saf4 n=1 Tax=Purpureocillium takamizusanense TaxID=2060973 RepID=A0A9Q8QGH4_9HYPO|nr:Protein saf4 [Purpureocillium takamizusanense]UNI18202.1 Protein saf4 [Purpureocillium takamizusanense]
MQGFNMGRYVPPDLEGTTTGNRLHGKKQRRPPSTTSTSSSAPAPTVRFEMPFAVWCASCPKPTLIGQGVRFNAQKRRAGAYLSTPVWSFRFRHADCGGAIEIRTDPQNTAYVVVEGGMRRDTGEDRQRLRDGDDGDLVVLLPPSSAAAQEQEEQARRRRTAFAKLERTIEDREQLRHAGERIAGLLEDSARRWDDPYAQNQRLRRAFRARRKQREARAADDDALRDRMGLAIDLLPETDDDARRAALVDFGVPDVGDGDGSAAMAKPLFAAAANNNKNINNNSPSSSSATAAAAAASSPSSSSTAAAVVSATRRSTTTTTRKPLKADAKAARDRDALLSTLVTNTRAAKDPFLQTTSTRDAKPLPPPRLPVKRKRVVEPESEAVPEPPPTDAAQSTTKAASGLVDYDSD